jgi:hypothetical protein
MIVRTLLFADHSELALIGLRSIFKEVRVWRWSV